MYRHDGARITGWPTGLTRRDDSGGGGASKKDDHESGHPGKRDACMTRPRLRTTAVGMNTTRHARWGGSIRCCGWDGTGLEYDRDGRRAATNWRCKWLTMTECGRGGWSCCHVLGAPLRDSPCPFLCGSLARECECLSVFPLLIQIFPCSCSPTSSSPPCLSAKFLVTGGRGAGARQKWARRMRRTLLAHFQ